MQSTQETTQEETEPIIRSSRKKSKRRSRSRRSSSGKRKRKHGPFYYEQLGAPCWIYHPNHTSNNTSNGDTPATAISHIDDYDDGPAPPWIAIGAKSSLGQTPFEVQAKMIHSTRQHRLRAQARWYYPMDFPVIRASTAVMKQEMKDEIEQSKKRTNFSKFKYSYYRNLEKYNAAYTFPMCDDDDDDDDSGAEAPHKKAKKKDRFAGLMPEEEIRNKEFTAPCRYSKRKEEALQARRWNTLDPFRSQDRAFLKSRVLGCVDEARATMLSAHGGDDNILDHLHPTARQYHKNRPYLEACYRDAVLEGHRKYDNAYLPARWKISQNDRALTEPKPSLTEKRINSALAFTEQRRNLADPAYLAPPSLGSLRQVLEADMTVRPQTKKAATRPEADYDPRDLSSNKAQDRPAHPPMTDPNQPMEYGNCLVCIPCSCPACSAAAANNSNNSEKKDGHHHPNMCLLHPIGELLDTLAASTLKMPQGIDIGAIPRTRRNLSLQNSLNRSSSLSYNEVKVGDSIRQILQCGATNSTLFLVRTSLFVTVVSVVPREDDSLPLEREKYRHSYTASNNNTNDKTKNSSQQQQSREEDPLLCWGTFQLAELQRIDLRSFSRRGPSYSPVDLTSHPKFNGSAVNNHQYKFAILSHSKHGIERNVIHHFLWSKGDNKENGSTSSSTPKQHVTKHVISNLKAISEIAFTVRHPMVLWAVATSYVRPAITPDRVQRMAKFRSRLGGGQSLYTIDLRTNEATFQWSPSSAEFLVEGVHSISGIQTEWNKFVQKNHIWVSSISAGKMWELDGQLFPIRVINTWSLPSQCDDCGPTLPHLNGLYGAGTLLTQPLTYNQDDTLEESGVDMPVLSIGKAPGTFGVQMYQRPTTQPRFQTDSVECASTSALSSLLGKKHSIAMSSIFAVPKTKPSVFTCGLAAVYLPVTAFITDDNCAQAGIANNSSSSLLCIITLVSTGDVFAHTLLGSRRGKNPGHAVLSNGLQVGSRSIPLPPGVSSCGVGDKHETCRMEGKLAGGMNLFLHLADSPVRPVASAGNTPNAESSVRPFQYADLRYIPATQRRARVDGTGEPLAIRSQLTEHDITVCRADDGAKVDTEDASYVKIPVESLEGSKQQVFSSSVAGLRISQIALVEKTTAGVPSKGARSDVTEKMLNFAEGKWVESA